MLPKKNRITKKTDFDAVFKNGRGDKEGFFLLKCISSVCPESRFGLIVSKKISKKAVVRNRIRRQLYSVIASQIAKINKAYECVVVALPGAEKSDFQTIVKTLEKLFVKTGIVKK